MEGEKPENLEKNPRHTGEANYNNSTHMSSNPSYWNGMDLSIHPSIHPFISIHLPVFLF